MFDQPVRRRTRTRREWLEVQRNISDLTDYEKQIIEFALRKADHFPRPEIEVKRLVEAHVNDQVVDSCVATNNIDFSVSELMQQQNHERSLEHLSKLPVPSNYKPCPSIDEIEKSFNDNNYFLNKDDIFSIHQAIASGRPIKVDGPPGTGKTELARQIAIAMGLDVNNPLHFGELFCTPDITKNEAFYSWNDARRLIDMQMVSNLSNRMNSESLKKSYVEVANNAYSTRYLDLQSLMRACVIPYRTVVLVDEIDKTYHEFDNYMLEVVDKNRFVVPEYGAVGRKKFDSQTSPIFVLTSNMTRSLSGPLVRRCKSLFYEYLPENLEEKVIRAKTGLSNMDSGLVAHFFKKVRTSRNLHLQQPPSTAEVIETVKALVESKVNITEQNILKMHCHWIKYRIDFNAISDSFKNDNNWLESIPET